MAGSCRCAWVAVVLIAGATLGASTETAPPPGTHVRGRIFDADSKQPVPGARVALFVSPPGPALPWDPERLADTERIDPTIDPEGRFDADIPARFGAGSHVILFAQAPGHAERDLIDGWYEEKDGPALTIGKDDLEVDVPLRRGRTLEGVVTGRGGKPLAGVRVDARVSLPRGSGDPRMRYGEPFPWAWPGEIVSDENGHWSLLGFPFDKDFQAFGGRWVLTFQHDRMAPVVLAGIGQEPDDRGVITIRTTMREGLTVRGVVVDVAGKPVAKARVRAERIANDTDPYAAWIQVETATDDQGRFELSGLDARPYTLIVWGHDTLRTTSIVDPTKQGPSSLNVQVPKGAPLHGTVRRHDGRPLSGVWVVVWSDKDKRYATGLTAETDGTFVTNGLAPGSYRIDLGFPLPRLSVTLPSPPLEIRVPERRELIVDLRDRITKEPAATQGTISFGRSEPSESYGQIGGSNRVSLGLVSPGSYTLAAKTADYLEEERKIRVEPGDGEEVFRWELSKGFELNGRVTDEVGAPIVGADVVAWALPGGGDEHRTTTGRDGRYRLGGMNDHRGLIGNVYGFFVHAPGKAPAIEFETFAFMSPFDRTHDFTLEDGGTVSGRVTGGDGAPVAGAVVRAYTKTMFVKVPAPLVTAYTGADGRYRLEHVPAGGAVIETMNVDRSIDVENKGSATLDFTVP